jgi:proline iminopeptidase
MRKTICLTSAVLLLCAATFAQSAAPTKSAKPAGPVKSAGASGSTYPIQEGFVDADGVLIYYWIIGRGQPLMIVHGGPGASHDYFLPWLVPLARTNRLIFIDERGSGKSERLEDATRYTVESMADDAEAVRQALGLGKISLLGHSYGGVVAQAYAFKYQQNLTHLILGSTFHSTEAINKALADMKAKMPSEDREKLEAYEKAGLFDKGKAWQHGRYPDEYAQLAWGPGYFPYLYQRRPDPNYDPMGGNASTSWELYREMWGSHGEFIVDGNLKSVEWADRLPSIKVPTLVMCGDHDESAPWIAQAMHEKIAGSKLFIFPESGHMTFVDQPSLFIKTVNDFVHGK